MQGLEERFIYHISYNLPKGKQVSQIKKLLSDVITDG